MIHRFSGLELNERTRELRLGDREIKLQPRVFDFIAYLVRHRDRVVGKEELLQALWPGVVVVDGALQRVVSLARSALREGGANEAIRTYARRGYRFCGELEVEGVTEAEPAPAPAVSPLLARARSAWEAGDWEEAMAAFAGADLAGGLAARDLERWGRAALHACRSADAVGPLERAVAAALAAGERRGAASAALLLGQIHFECREVAVASGWQRRAASFLDGAPECAELGACAWLAARIALAEGDLEASLELSERARDIGRRCADADVETLGVMYGGHARLALGDVKAGMAALDEAAAAVLAGEVGPWTGGMVHCGVVWACLNGGDWQRAMQWTEQFARWCESSGLSGFPGLCRLHHAEVLSIRGDLGGAEVTCAEARELLAAGARWAEGDAWRVLGEVRLVRGNLDGAEEAFRRAVELGWEPQPGYALLQLERGKPDAAMRSLERALAGTNWALGQRRGLLLCHLAVIAAGAGEPDRACRALAEVEARCGPEPHTPPALAAMLDEGRAAVAVAQGDTGSAVARLRSSLRGWNQIGSLVHAARTRLRLAQLLGLAGDAEGAELELCAAEAVFRRHDMSAMLRNCAALRASIEGRGANAARG